jgi:superfamily II DNA/RNA helicase
VSAKNRSELEPVIKANFDANYAGERKSDYDIIVTTEVLAEGVNLHRANFILNYDAPWNATRLMQRIGRVNRIGTQADFIHVYNFMPSAEGDQYIGLVGKAYVKIQSFQSLLGEDSKIFTNAETIETHDLNEITAENEESAFAPYIAELKAYKAANSARYAQIAAMQSAEASVSSTEAAYITVAPPNGPGLFVRAPFEGEAKVIPFIEMLAACKVPPETSSSELPENWVQLKEEAVTAFIHYHAPVSSHLQQTKAAKSAVQFADLLKSNHDIAATNETKKLLTVAKSLAQNGNVDVIKKLNAIGAHVYSPQMQLLPFTAMEVVAAIQEAFTAIAAAYEANKGKPYVVTALAK